MFSVQALDRKEKEGPAWHGREALGSHISLVIDSQKLMGNIQRVLLNYAASEHSLQYYIQVWFLILYCKEKRTQINAMHVMTGHEKSKLYHKMISAQRLHQHQKKTSSNVSTTIFKIRERQVPYDFTHVWNLMNKQN